MSICPICQSINHAEARSCHYCGASLERRHRAPSRPAPPLSTRPQSHHNPLSDLDLPALSKATHSRRTREDDYDFEFDLGADSLGGDRFTIDEDDESYFDDIESLTPAKTSQLALGQQLTFDESAEGLALMTQDLPADELSFSDTDHQALRPKLSDLGGDEVKSRSVVYRDESILGGRQGADHVALEMSSDVSSSLARKASQVLAGGIILVLLIWGLGLAELVSPVERAVPQRAEVIQTPASTRAILVNVNTEPTETDDHSPLADEETAAQSEADHTPQPRRKSKARRTSKFSRWGNAQEVKSHRDKTSMRELLSHGEQLLTQGKVRAAQRVFQRAQSAYPHSPAPIAQLGWCQLSQRNYKSALNYFERALGKSAHHGDSLYGLGYSYEKLGRTSEARRYFERYLARYPSGAKVRVVRNKLSRLPAQ